MKTKKDILIETLKKRIRFWKEMARIEGERADYLQDKITFIETGIEAFLK